MHSHFLTEARRGFYLAADGNNELLLKPRYIGIRELQGSSIA